MYTIADIEEKRKNISGDETAIFTVYRYVYYPNYRTLTTLKCLEKFRDFQIIRAFKQLAYKSFDIPS